MNNAPLLMLRMIGRGWKIGRTIRMAPCSRDGSLTSPDSEMPIKPETLAHRVEQGNHIRASYAIVSRQVARVVRLKYARIGHCDCFT